jgi:predicted ATPase
LAPNKWIVITGSPSTGKTTLIEEFERRGHSVLPEAARQIIDEALEKGIDVATLRKAERQFQIDIALRKQTNEAELDAKRLSFLDRGMQDTIAYMAANGFKMNDQLNKLMDSSKYHSVYLLEPLDVYVIDYARTEDEAFGLKLKDLLFDSYSKYGMTPTLVPAMSVEERADFILQQLGV